MREPRNSPENNPLIILKEPMMVPIFNGSIPRPPYSTGVEYTNGINADIDMSTKANRPKFVRVITKEGRKS